MFWLNYANVKTLALAWQVLWDWLLGKFDRKNIISIHIKRLPLYYETEAQEKKKIKL
jgi:hypothetical protein